MEKLNITTASNTVRKQKRFIAHKLYMRIAEPRVLRLMQFGVYICMIISGLSVLIHPPAQFDELIGQSLVFVFGTFVALGGLLGGVAVLPGIWWLERVGLLALTTGIAMYVVMVISLGSSSAGVIICIAFILTFLQRWLEIKGSQLAPREE